MHNINVSHRWSIALLARLYDTLRKFANTHFEGLFIKASNKKSWIIGSIWLIVIAVLIVIIMRSNDAARERQNASVEIPWDDNLLACNQVNNAEPTEDFETCLALAEDGWIDAALRIAWAYSRDGEFQSWQNAYEWLVWLSDHDSYAELLSYIVLFEIGDNEDLKHSGERGIAHMAVINEPAASAYLASLYYLGLNKLEQRSSVRWLIERAYSQSTYWVTPEQIAHIFLNGYLGEPEPNTAKKLLLNSTQEDFPINANNVAWLLATTDYPSLNDYPAALELAQSVVADEDYADSYVYVDTLAATFAANQNFEQAINTQREALALLKDAAQENEALNEQIPEFEARLALFEEEKVYKEAPRDVPAEVFFTSLKKQLEQALIESLYVSFEAPLPTIGENEN
ncbi:hypothetical protein PN836_014060 [Ningiella sp. W23]|uniref:hypothetical protein n=1 Tax=Ningiella sp. W23 TaxID=3023715 RepID=UPI003756782B